MEGHGGHHVVGVGFFGVFGFFEVFGEFGEVRKLWGRLRLLFRRRSSSRDTPIRLYYRRGPSVSVLLAVETSAVSRRNRTFRTIFLDGEWTKNLLNEDRN
jgi:hypothetical protein